MSETFCVQADSFVTLHYRIKLQEGEHLVASTFNDKPATLQLGQGYLAHGLEQCLLGMSAGQFKQFELSPEQGYGLSNPDLYRPVSKSLLNQFAEEGTSFKPGEFVHFPGPNGERFAGTVVEERETDFLFDFNHPLAGRGLYFDVQIIGVM